jgi:hypothetical protein
MEYTKSNWEVHGGVVETAFAPAGAVIAQVNTATNHWEANAHLIAAAPDMYEALQGLLVVTPSSFANRGLKSARENALQALAKAQGVMKEVSKDV